MKFDATTIIFDLDGTLVDSKDDIAASVNRALKKFGLQALGAEIVAKYVGTGVQPLLKSLSEEAPGVDPPRFCLTNSSRLRAATPCGFLAMRSSKMRRPIGPPTSFPS